MATINEGLEGHVALEVQCVDRLLSNGYVPGLQIPGQLVRFLCGHFGHPIPSPALLGRIQAEVRKFAAARSLPVLGLARPAFPPGA